MRNVSVITKLNGFLALLLLASLGQAALGLQDAALHRKAWRALAQLAEQRGDAAAAAAAWRQAAGD